MNAPPAPHGLARAWAALVASSAVYFLADNEADNDLWMHLFAGRTIVGEGAIPRVDDASYTAAGLPWVDHEWLTQVAMLGLFELGGSPLLWAAKVALALLTAWLVWLPVRRHAQSPWAWGPAMVLVLAVMSRGYAVRPQVLTYLGVAALLAWLDWLAESGKGKADSGAQAEGAFRFPLSSFLSAFRFPLSAFRSSFLLVAAGFALWANAHGAVIAGLGILAAWTMLPERLVGGDDGPPVGVRAALLATALLAVCLNPYGPGLFLYILGELRGPHPLSEWQPVGLGDAAQRPFLLLLALGALTLPFSRLLRARPWWAAIAIGVAIMACRSQRHTPLAAICAAAPLADQLDAALTRLAARTRFRFSAAATGLLAVALLALAGVQLATLAARLGADRAHLVFDAGDYPVGAVRHLRAAGLRGNLAVPLDWGGYVLWHASPDVRVSLDGRFATVYPPAVVEDGFAFFRADGDPAATRLLDAYDTTLVLVPRGIPVPVQSRPGWRLLYSDAVAALYGRDGEPARTPGEAPRGRLPFP